MAYSIFHDLYIDVSKETVFNAFVKPEHLNNWWTLKSSGEPKLHVEHNLNFTNEYDWYAEVSSVKENQSFYLKTKIASSEWMPTTFGINLEDAENGKLLKFSHTGWENNTHEFRNSSFFGLCF